MPREGRAFQSVKSHKVFGHDKDDEQTAPQAATQEDQRPHKTHQKSANFYCSNADFYLGEEGGR
jgi:hypothetical protein